MWDGGGNFSLSVEIVGSCWLLWGAPPSGGRAPFKKGAPFSEGARPYCLLDWQGAQAPSGSLVISSSSSMQLRVDEKWIRSRCYTDNSNCGQQQ